MLCLLSCLPLCALDAAAGFAIFAANPDGTGSVRLCSTNSASFSVPAGLDGLQLLGCVPAQSTPLDESLAGHARLRADLPQGTRVLLPHGRGSLYHYRRSSAGGTSYGFLLVDALGGARSLIELAAPPDASDPFLPSVASAPDGAKLLVATQPVAGGDLWELSCSGAAALNRTDGLDVQVFGRDSFFLGASLAAATTTSGVLRWDPLGDECAAPAAFAGGGAPAWLGLEVVPSANGLYVAFLGGDSPMQCVPFVLGATGAAQPMSTQPQSLSGAGFLPEASDGPWLAVSDDGQQCAWREADAHVYSRELYLARRASGGQAQAAHVTEDALFHPYIDEIGLAIFRPDGRLVFWAGDQGANGTLLTRADLFQASLDASGALSVQNLTLTSGEATPPFLAYPALRPEQVLLDDSGSQMLVFSRDPTGDHVLEANSDHAGLAEVLDGVSDVGAMQFLGDEVLLAATRPDDPAQSGISRVELGTHPESELFLQLSLASQHSRGLRGPDGWYAFVTQQNGGERLWQVNLSSDDTLLLTPRPLTYGQSLAYTDDGTLVFSVGAPGAPALFLVWPRNASAHRLWTEAVPGFVLPGA